MVAASFGVQCCSPCSDVLRRGEPAGQSVDPLGQLGEAPAPALEVERFVRAPTASRTLGQGPESLLRKPVTHEAAYRRTNPS